MCMIKLTYSLDCTAICDHSKSYNIEIKKNTKNVNPLSAQRKKTLLL